MKYETMFGFIEKISVGSLSFSGSLARIVNASNHTKCIVLNNQPCKARPTLIKLNPDEYNQGLHYYSFMVNLDRRDVNGNTLDDPSDKKFVPNRTEDVNSSVFNMITTINKSKTLKNHISCG